MKKFEATHLLHEQNKTNENTYSVKFGILLIISNATIRMHMKTVGFVMAFFEIHINRKLELCTHKKWLWVRANFHSNLNVWYAEIIYICKSEHSKFNNWWNILTSSIGIFNGQWMNK